MKRRPILINQDKDHKNAVKKPEPEANRKLVIKKTVTVGVMGTEYNVGTTHTVIMLANFLQGSGKTCAAELTCKCSFHEIEKIITHDDTEEISAANSFSVFGVDYFKECNKTRLMQIKTFSYDYAVLDFGADEAFNEDFISCDIQFIVASGAEWKVKRLTDFYKAQAHNFKDKWRYLIPFSDRTIKIYREALPNMIYRVPYHPDAFEKPTKEVRQIFGDAIGRP